MHGHERGMAVSAPALEVVRVSSRLRRAQGAGRRDLTAGEARFTALLGLNGAGKTTLFSLVTRLYDTRQGRSACSATRWTASRGRRCALLGVVFQARTLDLDLSVMDNLLYHAALHGMARSSRANAPARCFPRWSCRTARGTRRASCPAGRCAVSRSPAP